MRGILARIPKPTRLATLVIVAVVLAYLGASYLDGQRKLAALDEQWRQQSSDIRAYLAFEPENFHILRLQEAGRFAGYDSGVVTILDVSPEKLDKLSRYFWIRRIELLDEAS